MITSTIRVLNIENIPEDSQLEFFNVKGELVYSIDSIWHRRFLPLQEINQNFVDLFDITPCTDGNYAACGIVGSTTSGQDSIYNHTWLIKIEWRRWYKGSGVYFYRVNKRDPEGRSGWLIANL